MNVLRRTAVPLAIALYLMIGVFPFLASVLLAPPAGVAVLMALWVAGLMAMGLLHRSGHGLWMLTAPPFALVVWALVITIGEQAFRWTA